MGVTVRQVSVRVPRVRAVLARLRTAKQLEHHLRVLRRRLAHRQSRDSRQITQLQRMRARQHASAIARVGRVPAAGPNRQVIECVRACFAVLDPATDVLRPIVLEMWEKEMLEKTDAARFILRSAACAGAD